METLSFYEIVHITKYLNIHATFNFLKSINFSDDYELMKSIIFKKKNILVIDVLFENFFHKKIIPLEGVKELLIFFRKEIEIEDLICFTANIYPNNPRLEETILFEILSKYNSSRINWNLIQCHFKLSNEKMIFFSQIKEPK